jgi:probable HAF family extracellular repeat protein
VLTPFASVPLAAAACLFRRQIINLGTFGGYESVAGSVNSRGQVAGYAANNVPDPYFGTQLRAFLWDQKNGMQDLGTLGGPDATAGNINEQGQIVGDSFINDMPNPGTGIPTFDPFLWDKGRMIDLGTFGGTMGMATGINNRGQVLGYSSLPGDVNFHGFLWDHGALTDIGTLGGRGHQGTP